MEEASPYKKRKEAEREWERIEKITIEFFRKSEVRWMLSPRGAKWIAMSSSPLPSSCTYLTACVQ